MCLEMDDKALREIIVKIPELHLRFLGTFPVDRTPNLPESTFAIVNSAPSHSLGEHWVMIAKHNNKFYYADSLGYSHTHYKFLNKQYHKMIAKRLQQTDNLCGFYTIYSAFQLFKFSQEHIDISDVAVLIFISNFM